MDRWKTEWPAICSPETAMLRRKRAGVAVVLVRQKVVEAALPVQLDGVAASAAVKRVGAKLVRPRGAVQQQLPVARDRRCAAGGGQRHVEYGLHEPHGVAPENLGREPRQAGERLEQRRKVLPEQR